MGKLRRARAGGVAGYRLSSRWVALGFLVCLALLSASCRSVGSVPNGRMSQLPGADGEADKALSEIREALQQGADGALLGAVDTLAKQHPDHVDVQRLRQDLLRARGRLGLLRHGAEARVREAPGSAAAHYLLGRLLPPGPRQGRAFREACRLDPSMFWGWLGLGFALRRESPDRALQLYRELVAASGGALPAVLAAADLSLAQGAWEQSIGFYRRLDPDYPGLAAVGTARVHGAAGRLEEQWPHLLRGLELRPWDPAVHELLQQRIALGLSGDQESAVLELLLVDRERLELLIRGGGLALAVQLFQRGGRIAALDRWLLRVRADGGLQPAGMRALRRRLLARGQWLEFFETLDGEIPPEIYRVEANEVRGIWVTLMEGPWRSVEDPLADAGMACRLAHALMDAGLLVECAECCSLALERHTEDSALQSVLRECDRAWSVVRMVRRWLYGTGAEPGAALGDSLAALRRDLKRAVGEDVVGEPEIFSVPLVGEVMDPLGPGLPRWLARYNRHLILGQRDGAGLEGMMLTRLSLMDVDPRPGLPLPGRCHEVIGEDHVIRPLDGLMGGDPAGVALLNHVVVDWDEIRSWAAGLARQRSLAVADGGMIFTDPMPGLGGLDGDGVPDREDLLDPVGVPWRLVAQEESGEGALRLAVLDIVRRHEHSHLLDFFRHLPAETKPLRNLALLFDAGFSPLHVEGEFERRAELGALALSQETGLLLAHIARFLEVNPGGSPHGIGFRRLALDLMEELQRSGAAPEAVAVRNWHRLEPGEVRRAAHRLLQREPPVD